MSRFWSDGIAELTPYVPGEQPGDAQIIKLNTNENPWGPPPQVLAALKAQADERLRLYPDPNGTALKQSAAQANGLNVSQVFVGNGSDEVLAHCFRALLRHDAPLLFPDITYSFYPVYCGLFDIDYETVPLNARFEIAVDDYARGNGGIIFANPNAPTGIALSLAEIERLLQMNPDSVVVVDEAYVDFGGESAVSLISQYPQLLVIQTLSKSRALAGLRVGLAFGDAALIEALERVKNSFNSYPLDRFALAGACAAYEADEWFTDTCNRIIAEREKMTAALAQLGFETLPSATNFVFTRHRSLSGEAIAAALRERNIVVRWFDKPRIADYLRITIGSPAQCETLLIALQDIAG